MTTTKITNRQQFLIDSLVKSNQIDGRYEDIECIRYLNPSEKRGSLSIVFKATDTLEDMTVAIKVMDPEKERDTYRIKAFEREYLVLEKLIGNKRCAQLTDGMKTHSWDIPTEAGPVSFDSDYFVTEWVDEQLDDYVFKEDEYDAEVKLQLFRGVLLAIETVHKKNIFHRDVKIDNIRVKSVDNQKIVVLIDFGSAAHRDSDPIGHSASTPKGAGGYSPPEAFVGFAEDRSIAHLADTYAAGVLLYEFFNYGNFYSARKKTRFWDAVFIAKPLVESASKLSDRHSVWREHIPKLKAMNSEPDICGFASSVPPSIKTLVTALYASLIHFDFNKRADNLEGCVSKVDSSLRALRNQKRQSEYYRRKAISKQRKEEKILSLQERHVAYLKSEDSRRVK